MAIITLVVPRMFGVGQAHAGEPPAGQVSIGLVSPRIPADGSTLGRLLGSGFAGLCSAQASNLERVIEQHETKASRGKARGSDSVVGSLQLIRALNRPGCVLRIHLGSWTHRRTKQQEASCAGLTTGHISCVREQYCASVLAGEAAGGAACASSHSGMCVSAALSLS